MFLSVSNLIVGFRVLLSLHSLRKNLGCLSKRSIYEKEKNRKLEKQLIDFPGIFIIIFMPRVRTINFTNSLFSLFGRSFPSFCIFSHELL